MFEWMNDSAYQKELDELKKVWAINERNEIAPNKIIQTCELIKLEMKYHASFELSLFVTDCAYKLLTTKNVYFYNAINAILHENNLSHPPALSRVISQFGYDLLSGKGYPNQPKAKKLAQKHQTLLVMANMIFFGELGLEEASIKASVWFSQTFPDEKPRSSASLLKEYQNNFRTPVPQPMCRKNSSGDDLYYFQLRPHFESDEQALEFVKSIPPLKISYEDQLFENWSIDLDVENKQRWIELIDSLPEPSDEQLGHSTK